MGERYFGVVCEADKQHFKANMQGQEDIFLIVYLAKSTFSRNQHRSDERHYINERLY